MKKIVLPRTSKRTIFKELTKSEFEDVKLIKKLDKHLATKRAKVISFPPKGKKVILLLSGGMDSVVTWAILLLHYKLEVFPFVVESKRVGERKAVRFFTDYFGKKNLRGFHKPFIYKTQFLPKAFTTTNQQASLSTKDKLRYFNPVLHHVAPVGLFGANILSTYYGGYYSYFLRWRYGHIVNTIVSGINAEDGLSVASQTVTSLRTINVNLCTITHNPDLQLLALPLEPELGFFWTRRELMSIGTTLGIPLEKTYSCSNLTHFHCGKCPSCLHRQHVYRTMGQTDPTWYETTSTLQMTLTRFLDLATLK